jgi:hypothetical protein
LSQINFEPGQIRDLLQAWNNKKMNKVNRNTWSQNKAVNAGNKLSTPGFNCPGRKTESIRTENERFLRSLSSIVVRFLCHEGQIEGKTMPFLRSIMDLG